MSSRRVQASGSRICFRPLTFRCKARTHTHTHGHTLVLYFLWVWLRRMILGLIPSCSLASLSKTTLYLFSCSWMASFWIHLVDLFVRSIAEYWSDLGSRLTVTRRSDRYRRIATADEGASRSNRTYPGQSTSSGNKRFVASRWDAVDILAFILCECGDKISQSFPSETIEWIQYEYFILYSSIKCPPGHPKQLNSIHFQRSVCCCYSVDISR